MDLSVMQSELTYFLDTFCSRFHKKRLARSHVCRTAPNQSALQSPDPVASKGKQNFEVRPFAIGACLVRSFEVSRLPHKIENALTKSLQKIMNYLVPLRLLT